MKVLQICNKPPYPGVDGGAIAMNNITQGLIELGHEVKVLAVTTAKHPVLKHRIPQEYFDKTNFEAVFIDTSIRLKDAFFNLFEEDSYNIKRFISKEFQLKIEEILNEQDYDIVLLESLFVSPYLHIIKENSKAKIVLRSHNVEYKIWERIAKNTLNPLRKAYVSMLAKRLKKYEVELLNGFDGLVSVTEIDLKNFKKLGMKIKSTEIPIGIDMRDIEKLDKVEVEEKSVFHIASMDWMPNVDAVKWFLDKVWYLVIKKVPDAKLYLAGREMPDSIMSLDSDSIKVVGEVEDAKQFYQSKNIMIVPILSGSGMRVKIIEGMALGKVIVSTKVGAEGIHCSSGEDIMIADSPRRFAASIIRALNNKEEAVNISKNATELIRSKYDNLVICKKLEKFFQDL